MRVTRIAILALQLILVAFAVGAQRAQVPAPELDLSRYSESLFVTGVQLIPPSRINLTLEGERWTIGRQYRLGFIPIDEAEFVRAAGFPQAVPLVLQHREDRETMIRKRNQYFIGAAAMAGLAVLSNELHYTSQGDAAPGWASDVLEIATVAFGVMGGASGAFMLGNQLGLWFHGRFLLTRADAVLITRSRLLP